MRYPTTFFYSLLLVTHGAWGMEPVHDFSHLDGAITDYVKANNAPNARYEVHINALDPRLHLPRCADPVEIFTPPGHRLMGATLLGVRCNTTRAWVIYVSAQVKVFRNVATLVRAVARGAYIGPNDITFREQDVGSLSQGFFPDAANIVGKLAKRALAIGTVVTPAHLSTPRWVTRGEVVTLLLDTGMMQVRAQGEALTDGTENERVKARNVLSGKIVEGIVSAPGTLRVRM